jgi:hypothetical protein
MRARKGDCRAAIGDWQSAIGGRQEVAPRTLQARSINCIADVIARCFVPRRPDFFLPSVFSASCARDGRAIRLPSGGCRPTEPFGSFNAGISFKPLSTSGFKLKGGNVMRPARGMSRKA